MERTSATWLWGLAIALVALALGAFPSAAGAVVVHLSDGQRAGVTPVRGVSATTIRNRLSGSTSSGTGTTTASDNLSYNGGPVLHGVSPYLIFWDPSSQISAADKALYERYFSDSAASSGQGSNVFAVDRQFTDTTGFADYSQSWTAAHAVTDTQAYPSTASQCTEAAYSGETACLFDSQIQSEVARVTDAGLLLTGITGQAPIYFVVTPATVNTCFDPPYPKTGPVCGDNYYCAYHSSFTTGGHTVLYADMPTVLAARDPKSCQSDGTPPVGTAPVVQAPNGAPSEMADVVLKAVSHEESETITDPLGTGWFNAASGQEDGDQCNYTGTYNPALGANPNAFTPTLGGSPTASPTYGTLYNQLINANPYYLQSEWSNGDVNCTMKPTASAISAAFSVPDTVAPGVAATFDPSSSSSNGGYTSATWNFGDGTHSFARAGPSMANHTYAAAGTYAVTLTLVDQYGNLATVLHTITVPHIAAVFTASPTQVAIGQAIGFDASGSGDDQGVINSYTWDFGDGSVQTTSAPTISHSYASPGTKSVTLTVSDGTHAASRTQTIPVAPLPTAAFTVTSASPTAGSPVTFDGSGSSEAGGSIASYSWSFGDGATDTTSGVRPSHVYGAAGTYDTTLTVTDANGRTASVTNPVSVATAPTVAPSTGASTSPGQPSRSVPTAVLSILTPHPIAGLPVGFSAVRSSDVGSTIPAYRWAFGDGSHASGVQVRHHYAHPGHYTVSVSVTDGQGQIATSTRSLSVASAGITSIKIRTGRRLEVIRLQLSGPGTLRVDSRRFRIGRPRTLVYTLKLSLTQRVRLRSQGVLRIRLIARFSPRVGAGSRRVIRILIRS